MASGVPQQDRGAQPPGLPGMTASTRKVHGNWRTVTGTAPAAPPVARWGACGGAPGLHQDLDFAGNWRRTRQQAPGPAGPRWQAKPTADLYRHRITRRPVSPFPVSPPRAQTQGPATTPGAITRKDRGLPAVGCCYRFRIGQFPPATRPGAPLMAHGTGLAGRVIHGVRQAAEKQMVRAVASGEPCGDAPEPKGCAPPCPRVK